MKNTLPPVVIPKANPKDKAKDKTKADAIPITEGAIPSNNNEDNSDEEDEKDEKKTQKKRKRGKKVNRKKGPSGKPKINIIRFKSKKAAYEAAKRAGKGGKPIHHAHPKKGEPHFHPNKDPFDMKGLEKNILENGDHYVYPK